MAITLPQYPSSSDVAQDLTIGQIEVSREYADAAFESAQGFLNELTALFEDYDVPTLDINVPIIDVPDLNIELPPELEELDLELVITGTLPSPPVFNDSEVAVGLDIVFDRIYDTLENGGTGITEEVEDAIYNRARSRLDDEFREELEKLENFYSSRGHVAPPGVITGMTTRLSSLIVQKSADLNNDILVNQTKLAQQQIQFALATVVELFKVRLQEYATKVQAYVAEIDGYIKQIQAQVAVIEAQVRAFEANVNQYIATVEMQKVYYQTLSTKITLELQKAKLESDILIAEMNANLEAFVAVKGLQLESAKAGGSVMAQLAASALSSINTATGYNFSGSRGVSSSEADNEANNRSEVHQHIYPH